MIGEMLEELLRIMRQGGTQTTQGLAQQLGVTASLVEIMLADLERRGYVKQVGLCGQACSNCDLAASCEQRTPQKLWILLHKR